MFQLTKVIGNQYAIFDSSDYTIEWVPASTLVKLLSKGIVINGCQSNPPVPKTVQIPWSKCNWESGRNIFEACRLYSESNGTFLLKTSKKSYKGTVLKFGDDFVLHFNNGVEAVLDMPTYVAIRNKMIK